jgi:hypothetical protein
MSEVLERRFASVGARLSLADGPWRGAPRIDVLSDTYGEYFDVRFAGQGDEVEVEVVDARPEERHLLLLVRMDGEKSKFLCGHDERHWFVAAIPEAARGVTGVRTAKLALQPDAVRRVVERVRPKDQFRRRNEAYVRQGEWFFVPAALRQEPSTVEIRRNEPLMRGRGGSKAHVMELAYRTGGRVVYSNGRRIISVEAYRKLTRQQQHDGNWQQLVRDPDVYAKGAVRHPDHATIQLATWHRVLMNTEQGARAMRHVGFLD